MFLMKSPLGTRAAPDVSPDSLTFTFESNFSLFSSTSGSVDRSSVASDFRDQDFVVSQLSPHLAGREFLVAEAAGGPDPDPNKATVDYQGCINVSHKDKAKVQKQDKDADAEDENLTAASARSSFSQALQECQLQRIRSEILLKKADKRRPASLDLNNSSINVVMSSPRLGVMKKGSVSAYQMGAFPSPGTPNHRQGNVGLQKGWSSERVPLHTNANRRHADAALLPLYNGRTLPSKWEDAERWILSPVSRDTAARHSQLHSQRRPKSKSGPLGPPGVAYYSLYSPIVPTLEGGTLGDFVAASPFSTGVTAADGLLAQRAGGYEEGANFSSRTECIARSVSVNGCSELLNQPSLPGFQEVNLDDAVDQTTNVSNAVSKRDIAIQMSPKGSPQLPPKRTSSFADSTRSKLPIAELKSIHCKPEVRDVQVDEWITLTNWSKKQRAQILERDSENVDDENTNDVHIESAAWEVSGTTQSLSKIKKEEARITAWENLQKAKAEAAIHKLEIKLEKKRSSSMDKIMSKLRLAQKKAQEMRTSVLANQPRQVARASHKVKSFRKARQMASFSGCFTCRAL